MGTHQKIGTKESAGNLKIQNNDKKWLQQPK